MSVKFDRGSNWRGNALTRPPSRRFAPGQFWQWDSQLLFAVCGFLFSAHYDEYGAGFFYSVVFEHRARL